MKDVLTIILKSDEAAKQRVAGAEEYRKEQLASLQGKKEEITKAEIKKAVDEAVRVSEKRRSVSSRQIGELKKQQESAEEKMDDLYKNNEKKWVDQIVKNVIDG